MKKLVLITLAVALIPTAAFAQQSGMRGEVTDNTGGVLPGVTVEACSPRLIEGCRVAITDGAGIYFITSLTPGIYSVTMTLPGFSTFVQEEIELLAIFTGEINGELAVGGVEETITVTGESPIVDTVAAQRTETFSRELFDALPSTRNTETLGYLAQGVRIRNPDVGGLGGHNKIHSRGLTVHHTTAQIDGMQTDNADCDFCGGGKNLNPGYAAEFAMTTSSSTAETQTGGFRINLIPREGGNSQSGNAYIGFTGSPFSASNIDDYLRSEGITTGDQIVYNEEINPSWGGPIIRDRLWFFSSVRFRKRYTAIAGTVWPDSALMRDALPDLIGEQGISEGWGRSLGLRLTGQVSERQKVSAFMQRSFSLTGRGLKGWAWENVTLEPVEGARHRNPDSQRNYIFQAKYTYTPSARTLVEFGYSTNNGGGVLSNQPNVPITRRLGAGRDLNPAEPGDLTQCVVTPCFHGTGYDMTRAYFTDGIRRQDDVLRTRWGGDGHQWNMAFPKFTKIPQGSFSYVTGSHNFKAGFQQMNGRVGGQLSAIGGFFDMAYRQGVPNNVHIANETLSSTWGQEMSFYAQDTWTMDRLTINLGLRNDNFKTGNDMWRAEGGIPASRFKHARLFDSDVIDEITPNDFSPRFSIVYDLFGDAKTAVKFSANRYTKRYVAGLGARYHPVGWGWDWRPWADCSLLPSSKIPGGRQVYSGGNNGALCPTQGDLMAEGFSQTEADFYLSTNFDGIAQDNEIGRRGNLRVFSEVPQGTANRSGNRIAGDLKRESNVEYSASIQHEILPRVSVTFAYYYRTFFNQPSSINAALPLCNPYEAVPGTLCGAYNVVPVTFNDRFGVLPDYDGTTFNVFNRAPEYEGLINDIVDSSSDRNGARYQAYELSFQARLPNGGTAFGGWTGHQHAQDTCGLENPNGGNVTPMINGEWRFQQGGRYCSQINPELSPVPWAGMPFRHDFKFFAVYPLPFDFQMAGGLQMYSGDEKQVMYQVQPGDFPDYVTQTFAPTVVVNAPGELYQGYWQQVDFNIRKHFRFRGVEYTAQIDIFNALNDNSIINSIQNYSSVLFRPLSIMAGRVTKLAVQVNW